MWLFLKTYDTQNWTHVRVNSYMQSWLSSCTITYRITYLLCFNFMHTSGRLTCVSHFTCLNILSNGSTDLESAYFLCNWLCMLQWSMVVSPSHNKIWAYNFKLVYSFTTVCECDTSRIWFPGTKVLQWCWNTYLHLDLFL